MDAPGLLLPVPENDRLLFERLEDQWSTPNQVCSLFLFGHHPWATIAWQASIRSRRGFRCRISPHSFKPRCPNALASS